jgi:hypothetical protein
MPVRSGFKRWERRARRPPLSCSIPHRGGGFGLSAEGEGLEPPRDLTPLAIFETLGEVARCRHFPCRSPARFRHHAPCRSRHGESNAYLKERPARRSRQVLSPNLATTVASSGYMQDRETAISCGFSAERRGRDSNPRGTKPPRTVFETLHVWLNHAPSGLVRDTTRDSSGSKGVLPGSMTGSYRRECGSTSNTTARLPFGVRRPVASELGTRA